MWVVMMLVLVGGFAPAWSEDLQPKEKGIEAPDYVWNAMTEEKRLALNAKPDPRHGESAFAICQGCHRAGALGRPDGSYPRLAGQHATVLIKQMTDIRNGQRDNPKMYPFANEHVIGPQDIADIAAYLEQLPVPADNGQGPGVDLDRAKVLYARDCRICHGGAGEGNAVKFYPRVSGQHFRYLLRESLYIHDGKRRNANPKMVEAIKPYSAADIEIVADYLSRLPVSR
jgi:cytochrome c553